MVSLQFLTQLVWIKLSLVLEGWQSSQKFKGKDDLKLDEVYFIALFMIRLKDSDFQVHLQKLLPVSLQPFPCYIHVMLLTGVLLRVANGLLC